MYSVTKTPYGFLLYFSGTISLVEITRWYNQLQPHLQPLLTPKPKFGIVVHREGLAPMAENVKVIYIKGMTEFRTAGMLRSAFLVDTITDKNLARETAEPWERYFALGDPGHEVAIMDWVTKGIDPH
jgi:hypothetical protein